MTRGSQLNVHYTKEDVRALQGTFPIEHTIAARMSNKLRSLLAENEYINTGAYNGQQAVESIKAGLTLYIYPMASRSRE